MHFERVYKNTSETRKLENLLMETMRKLPTDKRCPFISKKQFNVLLLNIPAFLREHYKVNGIPLGTTREFLVRCKDYED